MMVMRNRVTHKEPIGHPTRYPVFPPLVLFVPLLSVTIMSREALGAVLMLLLFVPHTPVQ